MISRKLMLKTTAAALSALVMLAGCGKAESSSESKPKVYEECEKAQAAVDKFGAGWNLGNTLDSTGICPPYDTCRQYY